MVILSFCTLFKGLSQCGLVALFINIIRIDTAVCGTVLSNFDVFRDRKASSPVEINSHIVISMIRCATLCNINPSCMSFSYNCSHGNLERKTCQHYSSYVSNFIDLQPSSACYVQKIPDLITTSHTSTTSTTTTSTPTTTSTTPTTATPTIATTISTTASAMLTTTTPTSTSTTPIITTSTLPTRTLTTLSTTTTTRDYTNIVIDFVFGPENMCPYSSNSKDFVLLTSEGVYIYDRIGDLTTAPCRGPLEFTSVFGGYPSLTSIDKTDGVFMTSASIIELYSEGMVYRWQIENGRLDSSVGSITEYSHLGTFVLTEKAVKWAAYRAYNTPERHFYLGGDQYILISEQNAGYRTYEKDNELRDDTGFNLNPWANSPADIIAATGFTTNPNNHFCLIDSEGMVYSYTLDHISNYNNPTSELTVKGLLMF